MSKKGIFHLLCIIYLLVVFAGCQLFVGKPETPELLYVVQADDGQVTVMWKNVENAETYTVFWSEDPNTSVITGASKTITALDGDTRTVTFPNSDFTIGKTLYFWIYAENYLGTSSISSSKTVYFAVQKKWTIMVWLDGDNSLLEAAAEDFHEMETGLYTALQSDPDILDNLNIIVQYDGTESGDYGRFLVQPRNAEFETDTPLYGKIIGGLLSEPNMGDAEQLQDFIEFSKQNYPADKYALILWNHGGGVRSLQADSSSRDICEDSFNNDPLSSDSLYIGEIKDILESQDSVDFLGMDACLMGMTEIAYEFRPGSGDFGAQAMAFSPAEEQGDGWEYQKIINRLRGSLYSDGTSKIYYDIELLTANDFAQIVVEEYEAAFFDHPGETQTAVDLTKIGAVKAAVDGLARLLVGYKDEMELIRGSSSDFISDDSIEPPLMHYFDASSGSEWENYASFDLYDLAWRIRDSIDIDFNFPVEIWNQADLLMDTISEAIIYSWAGTRYNGEELGGDEWKNGLSIFFPDGDADNANRTDSLTYWTYQYFYTSLPHSELSTWAGNTGLNYGAIDFCNGDGDGVEVDGWFELLQYWYNPTGSTSIHPGPMW